MCNFFCLLISVLTLAVGKILLNNNIDKIETEETYAESDFYFQVVTKSYKAGSSKTTKSEGSESGQTSQSDDVPGCFDVGWYEDENDNKKNFDATLGYSGGSHDGGNSSVTATYNSAMPAITTPSRTGYSFQGYYTGTNGSGTKYYDNNGKSVRNWDKTSNTTLYAYWTANGYTLTANANGGSGSMSNQSMTYDKASNLTANTYTRQGYYFVGWSKTKLGVRSTIPTSNIYKDEESVKNLVASGSITLYAVWLDTWANHVTTPTGSGSSASPYIIDSAEDLAWLIKNFNNGNKSNYFKQTTDINLSKYYWSPIGSSSSSAFMGVYDGQNNQITNLKIPNVKNASGKYLYSYMGLFGYTKNGTFKNLIIVSGEVYGNVGVGALVGQLTSGVVENAILQAGVKVEGYQNVGGIVGYYLGGTIKNCENYSSVNTTNWTCGGILGWAQSGNNTKIEDCMNFGKITSNGENVGGINGGGGNFIVESCYNYGDLSAVGAHAGGIAGGVESSGVEIKNSYSFVTF